MTTPNLRANPPDALVSFDMILVLLGYFEDHYERGASAFRGEV